MFLKNRNIIFKMKISKVTDYAALIMHDKLKVSRRWQCKAMDMFDRRLHEILLDRRASECRSSESMRENQNKPFAC